MMERSQEQRKGLRIAIGISLVKNTSRFEWFLEKATEIGVAEIIPLQCARTVKEKFRFDRMEQILTSAMLQSQQCWKPMLHPPTAFDKALELSFDHKMIAHCVEEEKQQLSSLVHDVRSKLILIGPEGDFTSTEIANALQHGFTPVSLGHTRLRTETAGLVAAALLCSQ
jgi:16S rRNA (uracil1498-N3)-methyltransferase